MYREHSELKKGSWKKSVDQNLDDDDEKSL